MSIGHVFVWKDATPSVFVLQLPDASLTGTTLFMAGRLSANFGYEPNHLNRPVPARHEIAP
ncbi:MAG: hypothetical protein OEN55_16210, partial [Alphaproteobacteria bacterium]|nr:hypothetical protein [Alphaproteobacteria bacterium]